MGILGWKHNKKVFRKLIHWSCNSIYIYFGNVTFTFVFTFVKTISLLFFTFVKTISCFTFVKQYMPFGINLCISLLWMHYSLLWIIFMPSGIPYQSYQKTPCPPLPYFNNEVGMGLFIWAFVFTFVL